MTDRKPTAPPPRSPTALFLASAVAALVVLERWLARKQGRARWL